MKTFKVFWQEEKSVLIKAKNKEDARERLLSGIYQEQSDETASLIGDVDAIEMKIK